MIGVIYFTLIAFILSVLIVIFNSLIKKNVIEEKIVKLLPGYNCGSCGFGSCSGMAKEVINNKDSLNKCRFCKKQKEIYKILK